jgi:hypothetical protein
MRSERKRKPPNRSELRLIHQAMVSMMLPSVLVELLEEFEFEPPRSAIELLMNDEMID